MGIEHAIAQLIIENPKGVAIFVLLFVLAIGVAIGFARGFQR